MKFDYTPNAEIIRESLDKFKTYRIEKYEELTRFNEMLQEAFE